MANNGPVGGLSLGAPRYFNSQLSKKYVITGGVQPVLQAPQYFVRMAGQQVVSITLYNTGTTTQHNQTVSLPIQGGSNVLSNGYQSMNYDPSARYIVDVINSTPVNCTFTYSSPTYGPPYLDAMKITTNAPDSRTYTLQFAPYGFAQPLIQCTTDNGGDPLTLYDVVITTSAIKFLYQQ